MTIEEVLQHDLKFRYMLLGRLQADCEYYIWFWKQKFSSFVGWF